LVATGFSGARTEAPVYLRAACAEDQAEIVALVRSAGINPLAIHWPHFLVVEEVRLPGAVRRIVGIGQIKPHRDGRELASIAVAPDRRSAGLAGLLIHELLRREQGVVFLYCGGEMPAYYRGFGFVEVGVGAMPPSMRPLLRVGQALVMLLRLAGRRERLTAMRRDPPSTGRAEP
jgi:N-acetylglutamate synthase-like GNAT family acetyltransferase